MQLTRRDVLRYTAAALVAARVGTAAEEGAEVNDVHSQLNATRVAKVIRPRSVEDLREAILRAREEGLHVSVSGSRHSMGGQQFGSGMLLLDMRGLNRVVALDSQSAVIEAESGIEWPELVSSLEQLQTGQPEQLGIIQKQTGADRLSLGGALASNVHSRGLTLKPIISNVESFELMNAAGELVQCSRTQNPELFRIAIGGYGLFGVITSVRLRLRPRGKVRRVVKIADLHTIPDAFSERIRNGYLYGDYQFATDSDRDSFMRRGVFSCYQPVDASTPLTKNPTRFNAEDWARLTRYAHTNKRLAFEVYSKRYVATSGQVYYHDSQLSAAYDPGYHTDLDRVMKAKVKATEMITEIFVPRSALVKFMEEARIGLRELKANVIYGTVRLIEQDDESFLRWARESWACVIFNLHVIHDRAGIDSAARAFRALIDLGIEQGGSYYLTYHRWATKQQVEACYPQFREFLSLKREYDPAEVFQSDWYVHHKTLLG